MKNSLAHPCNSPLRAAPPQSVGQASPASIANRPYLSAASRAFSIPVYGFVPGGENVGRQSLPNRKRSL